MLIAFADCFHVNRYVTDALQHVRKHIQKDLSPFAKADVKHYANAQKGYERSLAQDEAIEHPIEDKYLKTMQNWQEEICNYHQFRFTNASIEGKIIKSKRFSVDTISHATL